MSTTPTATETAAPNAIRGPNRGKAHRSNKQPGGPAEYFGQTVCGKFARDMTQTIPVDRTDPSDRCIQCWKGTPWEARR